MIAHNYPGGNLDASEEDLKLTKRIKEAGELLDGRLIDHLILGIDDDYSSFTEKGWFWSWLFKIENVLGFGYYYKSTQLRPLWFIESVKSKKTRTIGIWTD